MSKWQPGSKQRISWQGLAGSGKLLASSQVPKSETLADSSARNVSNLLTSYVHMTRVPLILLMVCILPFVGAGRARGRSRGKGKNLLPFGNIAEFSLVNPPNQDPNAASIVKGSHFTQTYKLGYKILLICVAEGLPRPAIKWYKDGSEVHNKLNTHFYEKHLLENGIWSKIEIDPATMGDQGIYSCMANNEKGLMVKNFKAEYEL